MTSFPDTRPTSKIDRVRLRVTKLMRMTHDAASSSAPAPALGPEPRDAALSLRLSRLADDLRALQAIIEDTEQLIRHGWEVAVALNQVRRHCCRCEWAGALSEAAGTYQALLNQGRHKTQAAGRAVADMLAFTRTCALPHDDADGAQAVRASDHSANVAMASGYIGARRLTAR